MPPADLVRSYSFGSITVGERTYAADLIIYQDRVEPDWWRAEGHVLASADLAGPIAARPEVLVIGTGYFGVMKVPEKTKAVLAERSIAVVIERTGKAVEIFNDLRQQGRNVVAALHLTC